MCTYALFHNEVVFCDTAHYLCHFMVAHMQTFAKSFLTGICF